MWICFNDAFISVVEDLETGLMKVRARKKSHLQKLFPSAKIHMSLQTDYRFRVFVTRADVLQVVGDALMVRGGSPRAVTYTNFKNSVRDEALHKIYEDFWAIHFRYQHQQPTRRRKKKSALRPAWDDVVT